LGIPKIKGVGSVDEVEQALEKGKGVFEDLAEITIKQTQLSKELSLLLEGLYSGKLSTKLIEKLILSKPEISKKVLKHFIGLEGFFKRGDTIKKALLEYSERLGIEIAGKTDNQILKLANDNQDKIINFLQTEIVDEMFKSPGQVEKFLADILEGVSIISLDKRTTKILIEGFEENVKKAFNLSDITDLEELIGLVKEIWSNPQALKEVEEQVENALSMALESALKQDAGVRSSAKTFFQREGPRGLAKVLPGGLRTALKGYAFGRKWALATMGNFVYKNVLGAEGLLGVIYKRAAIKMKDLFKWEGFFKGGLLKALKNIPNSYIRTIALWAVSLPFFVLGKLNIFAIYYTRYYRHYCGTKEDFMKDIGNKALKELLDVWEMIGSALFSPLLAIGQLAGDEFSEKQINKLQNQVKKTQKALINWYSAKSPDAWYEQLSDAIVNPTKAAFRCKKREKILATSPGFMRGEVLKEIEKMEKKFSYQALKEMRKAATSYNKSFKALAANAGNENFSVPEFARMSQEAIGNMTPVEQIVGMSLAPSPAKIAAKVAKKEENNPSRTPEQREAAKQARRQFEGMRGQYEESKNKESLSDYREKLLEERLQKLTIGLIK